MKTITVWHKDWTDAVHNVSQFIIDDGRLCIWSKDDDSDEFFVFNMDYLTGFHVKEETTH